MVYGWQHDPCKIVENSEQQITCPACIRNKYSIAKNGWKTFYCEMGYDQNEGTRGQRDCKDFYHKSLARR